MKMCEGLDCKNPAVHIDVHCLCGPCARHSTDRTIRFEAYALLLNSMSGFDNSFTSGGRRIKRKTGKA